MTEIYINTDNTDGAAVWERVAFAKKNITTKTANYTLVETDEVVVCNSTTAFTITLPAATGSGQTYRITNINTGAITIDADGAELVKGALTQTIYNGDDLIITDIASGVWA